MTLVSEMLISTAHAWNTAPSWL